MTEKISVRGLYKIFGPNPHKAFELIKQDLDKDNIFSRTGCTIGVRDAHFDINEGEIFVIMGLSGSGKSTLVRMLNRLIEPTAGEVLINGKNIMTMNKDELIRLRRSDIAMVFQSFALLPHLTVAENAAFGLDVAGIDKEERRERALAALEQVGLKANADSFPDELSGGMQQRVGLARALATNPGILLMDEAFSALDPLIRREMQEELLRLQEEHERTVVFISHDLDEAMRIGDRIAIMEGGRVLQVGNPRDILDNPASEYVQAFFQDVDLSQVYSVGDIVSDDMPRISDREDLSVTAVIDQLKSANAVYGYVVDPQDKLLGVVSLTALERSKSATLDQTLLTKPAFLRNHMPLSEALGKVASTPYPVPVLNKKRLYIGTVSRSALLSALEKQSEQPSQPASGQA